MSRNGIKDEKKYFDLLNLAFDFSTMQIRVSGNN